LLPAEILKVFRVGAAMRDDFVPTLPDALHDLRRELVEQAVRVVRERHVELLGELEQAPDADAVAVIAPRVIALRLRLAVLGVVVAAPAPEREDLDVGRDAERETLAARPGIVLALGEWQVVVARVLRYERGHWTGPFNRCGRPRARRACRA